MEELIQLLQPFNKHVLSAYYVLDAVGMYECRVMFMSS